MAHYIEYDSYEEAQYAANVAQERIDKINSILPEATKAYGIQIAAVLLCFLITSIMPFKFLKDFIGSIAGLALLCLVIYNYKCFYSKIGYGSLMAMTLKVGYWAWFLIPIFPIDIIVFLVGVFYAGGVFLAVPPLAMFLVRSIEIKEKNNAESVMRYYASMSTQRIAVNVKYCKKCGAQLSADSTFCNHCGYKL